MICFSERSVSARCLGTNWPAVVALARTAATSARLTPSHGVTPTEQHVAGHGVDELDDAVGHCRSGSASGLALT